MAVPARLISIELTRTAHSASTAVKANIARAVASVKIARLRLLPSDDSIDHAPICRGAVSDRIITRMLH